MRNTNLDSRAGIDDLIYEADRGANCRRIVQCSDVTKNTPYSAGLIKNASSGTAYINASSLSYATILYISSGAPRIFLKCKIAGTWKDWEELVSFKDLFSHLASATYTLEDVIPAGGSKTVTITFDKAFSSTPSVCVSLVNNTDSAIMNKVNVYVRARYSDHFIFTIQNGSDDTVRPAVNWIATSLT